MCAFLHYKCTLSFLPTKPQKSYCVFTRRHGKTLQAKKKHAPHQEHADYTIVKPAKSRLEVFAMCLTGIPGSQL